MMNDTSPTPGKEGSSSQPIAIPPPETPKSPFHWWHLEWNKIKPVWPSFLICLVISTAFASAGVYWLVDRLYSAELRGKEATIQNLQNAKAELDDAQREVKKLTAELSSEQNNVVRLTNKMEEISRSLNSTRAENASIVEANQLAESNLRTLEQKLEATLFREKALTQELEAAKVKTEEVEARYAAFPPPVITAVENKPVSGETIKKRESYQYTGLSVGEGESWSDPLTGAVFGCSKIIKGFLTVVGTITLPDGKVIIVDGEAAGKAWPFHWNGRRFLIRFSVWIKPTWIQGGRLFVNVQETTDDSASATSPATAPQSGKADS